MLTPEFIDTSHSHFLKRVGAPKRQEDVVANLTETLAIECCGRFEIGYFAQKNAKDVLEAVGVVATVWDWLRICAGDISRKCASETGIPLLAAGIVATNTPLYRVIESICATYERDPAAMAIACDADFWDACEFLVNDIRRLPVADVAQIVEALQLVAIAAEKVRRH